MQEFSFLFKARLNVIEVYKFYLSLVAAFTMFVGMTFPFFGGLLSFFGGFAFAPTTYFVRKLFESPFVIGMFVQDEWFLHKDDTMFAYSVFILISPFLLCSCLASCGFPSINRGSLARLGVQTGYD